MMTIRPANTHDIPQLQAMQREGWNHDYVGYMPEAYTEFALKRYGSQEALQEHLSNYRYYFVAEEKGAVMGCITGDHVTATEAEIWWIHVFKAHRGKGVGKKLFEHFLKQLSPGITTLYVTTFQNYVPTLAFYKALGFQEHEKKTAYYDGIAVQDTKLRITLSRETL